MNHFIDYYKRLECAPDATQVQIKKHYYRLAKKFHPDHGGDTNIMDAINEAYSVLSMPRLRDEYDTIYKTIIGSDSSSIPNQNDMNDALNRFELLRIIRQRAKRQLGVGIAWLGIAGIISAVSYYSTTAGGRYFVLYGALLYGVILFLKGLYYYIFPNKLLNRGQAIPDPVIKKSEGMNPIAEKKLISGWSLWRQTLVAYHNHWQWYSIIVLVITIPTAIIVGIAPTDSTVAAYGSLAALMMNVALIYAINHFDKSPDSKPKLRGLFYESSEVFVRYIVVGLVLAIMLIPAAWGLGIVGLGGNTTTPPPLGELVLFAIIGFIVAIPSIYLLTRNGLAIILVFQDKLWPAQALRRSRELTKGWFWPLIGRYLILSLGLLIAIIPFSLIFIGLLVSTQNQVFATLFQISNATIILPLLYLYLFKLKHALDSKNTPISEK